MLVGGNQSFVMATGRLADDHLDCIGRDRDLLGTPTFEPILSPAGIRTFGKRRWLHVDSCFDSTYKGSAGHISWGPSRGASAIRLAGRGKTDSHPYS